MAETFGEADVILRVRLDELERDLAASERLILQSNQRVADAQIQAQQEITQARQASNDGSLVSAALTAAGAWKVLRIAVGAVGAGLASIPGLAAAASAAMLTAIGAATAGLTLVAGLLAEIPLKAERGSKALWESYSALDGTTDKARDFAEQLARIPIIGGLIANTFKGLSGDATLVQESWTGIVAKIEDGQVKLNLFGRAMNALINANSAMAAARWLGFDTDFADGINKANDVIQQLNRTMAQRNRVSAGSDPIQSAAQDTGRNAAREAELAGLESVERVRAEERHRAEDLKRFFEDRREQLNQLHKQESDNIQRIKAEQGLSSKQERELRADLSRDIATQQAALARLDAQAQADMEAAAKRRIKLAEEELAMQRKITEQRNAAAMARLVTGTQVMSLQATGQDFEAQRAQAEADRQAAILQAQQDGQQNMIDSINAFYDARGKLIDQREREQRERDEKSANERATAMLQANERLRSSLLQMRLEMNGQSLEAQQEAIRQRFQEQIDQMEAQGNQIGADLARKLRDAETQALGTRAELDREQANAELASQLRVAQLRAVGLREQADAEATRFAYAERIKQLEAQGNDAGAELARKLQALELDMVRHNQRVSRNEGQQVTLSRFSPGMDDDNVSREQLKVLQAIQENTSKRNTPMAVAG